MKTDIGTESLMPKECETETREQLYKIGRRLASMDEFYNIFMANRQFLTYFEKGGNRIFTVTNFMHPDDLDAWKEFVNDKESLGKEMVLRLKNCDGDYRYNVLKLRSQRTGGDGKIYTDIEIIDIEEASHQNEQMTSELVRYRTLMGMTGEHFFLYDKSDNVFRMFHYDKDRRVMMYEEDLDLWTEEMLQKRYVEEEEKAQFLSFASDMKSYVPSFTYKLTSSICSKGIAAEFLRISGIVHDEGRQIVMGRIVPEAQVAHASGALTLMNELKYDSLTGVYNKKTITEAAMHLVKTETNNRITIVIIDVDRFKDVNDSYGHMCGDKVLARVGQKLKEVVGDDGLVGRIGGDEFMLVLTRINDDQMLRSILRAVKMQIKWEFAEEFQKTPITCSIGASICPNNGTEYEDLFEKADYCLYIAKEKGRDRYVYFRDELHRQSYEESVEKRICNPKENHRDIRELQFVKAFLEQAVKDRKQAVKEALLHMKESYHLDSISVYYGEDMKRVYCMGEPLEASEDAQYVRGEEYRRLLNQKQYVKVNFAAPIANGYPEFYRLLKEKGVVSTVQCIIGTPDNIKGLITLDRCREGAQWADYEVDFAMILASLLTLAD